MIKSADEFQKLRLSEDPDDYYRAAHDEAPIAVWWEVLRRSPELAFWVAQNKKLQVVILQALYAHPDDNVRCMVARKRNLPEQIMLAMAQDESESVRYALVNNGKATVRALRVLEQDPWEVVRERAFERLGALTNRSTQLPGSSLR